jgi:hypothetical protein
MSSTRPPTLFIGKNGFNPKISNAAERASAIKEGSTTSRWERSEVSSSIGTAERDSLVPVKKGDPWSQYIKDYNFELEEMVTAVHHCRTLKICAVRTFEIANSDSKVHMLRQIKHQNILELREIFVSNDTIYTVSEPMSMTLDNICRAPKYPTEPQLGEIAFQVTPERVPFDKNQV